MAKEFWSNNQRRLGHPLSNGQRYGKWSNFENSRNFRINNWILSKRQVKNKCDNIGREETMTNNIDILKINDYIDFMIY